MHTNKRIKTFMSTSMLFWITVAPFETISIFFSELHPYVSSLSEYFATLLHQYFLITCSTLRNLSTFCKDHRRQEYYICLAACDLMVAKTAKDKSEITQKSRLSDPFLTIRSLGLWNKIIKSRLITTRIKPQMLA